MCKTKSKKGITLVSLVITIIVLMILAGVAISLATGEDSIFSKANEAASKWNTAVGEESNTIKNSGANKQMIWGCQYDQVIKFIGEQAQVGHSDRKLTEDHALSGQNELDCMNNIYDLEGNYNEWTAESASASSRVFRGDYYGSVNFGSFNPASAHSSSSTTSSNNSYYSSRSTLYL